MRASFRKVGRDHLAPSGRVLPVAMLVLLATTAACSGDRGKPASTGDTTGTATGAAPTDTANTMRETATTPTSDSTTTATGRDTSGAAPAKSDSGARPATAARRPSDTTRKRPQSAGPRPANGVATASKDTGTKAQDTTAKAKADTGAAAPAQTEAPLRDAYHQAPRDTVSEAVYDGWKQFNLNCARCHGEDALGTSIAPHLIVSLRPDGPINSKELFMSTVCAGRPAKGMPAWCSLGLTMDKIQDIYAYVKGRSDGKIAPGRPAVREGT
jgi:mono/diheme cytochrome c family protein